MRRSRWNHPFRRQLAVAAPQLVSPACIYDDSACCQHFAERITPLPLEGEHEVGIPVLSSPHSASAC